MGVGDATFSRLARTGKNPIQLLWERGEKQKGGLVLMKEFSTLAVTLYRWRIQLGKSASQPGRAFVF